METLLSLSNVYAGYTRAPILQNLSMQISKGGIYGLLGEANSGKSTLLRVIAGQLPILKGDIHWHTKPSVNTNNVGTLFGIPRLYQNLSIREHLKLFGDYYQLSSLELEHWLRLSSLHPLADQKIRYCPKSSLKRLGLVITLITKPSLLMIDDPEEDLNPSQQQRFFQLLRKIAHKHKTTFLITSQNASLLEHWSDQLGILQGGKLVWEGAPNLATPAVVFVSQPTSSLLVDKLIAQKELPYEWLDQKRVRVKVRLQSDVSMLARHLVLHGIELLGIEQEATPFAEVLALHAPSLRA